MSRRALILMGGLLAAVGARGAAPEGRLFHIERSKNANIVAYDVRLNPRGTIDTGKPIDGYWVRLAQDGRRDELSGIEKRLAYGWNTKPNGEDSIVLSIKALPDRPMTVVRGEQGYEARLVISGDPARLVKVYVKTKEGGVLPKVEYIDFFGRRLEDGGLVQERLSNR